MANSSAAGDDAEGNSCGEPSIDSRDDLHSSQQSCPVANPQVLCRPCSARAFALAPPVREIVAPMPLALPICLQPNHPALGAASLLPHVAGGLEQLKAAELMDQVCKDRRCQFVVNTGVQPSSACVSAQAYSPSMQISLAGTVRTGCEVHAWQRGIKLQLARRPSLAGCMPPMPALWGPSPIDCSTALLNALGDNFYINGCYADDNTNVNASLRCAHRFKTDWCVAALMYSPGGCGV